MCYMNMLIFVLSVLFSSGCVNRMAANMAYPDLSAAAAADRKECAQGDKEQCVKLQRASDHCHELIARGGTSASALVCQHLVDNGDISQR